MFVNYHRTVIAFLLLAYNQRLFNSSIIIRYFFSKQFVLDELSASVLEEWKKMKKQHKISSTLSSPAQNDQAEQQKQFIIQNTPSQFNMLPFANTLNGYVPNLHGNDGNSKSGKEQPMFTAKQVVMVCERLWKEREEKLREEYDQVLHDRLSGMFFKLLSLF